MACKETSRAALGMILIISLIAIPGIAAAATNPLLTATCARAENIVIDGGFEEEAGHYLAPCPCLLVSPWVMNQSGKGGATAQRGWGTEGSYAAVVSLDDSAPGDWISISQVIAGDQYCTLDFTYSTWLSQARESDLYVYMDNGLIWSSHEVLQGRQPLTRNIMVDVSSFSGVHTLRFLQKATTGGIAHSDWFIDDIRLMAGSSRAEEEGVPVVTKTLPGTTPLPKPTNTTPARTTITRRETPPPLISPTMTATPALPQPVKTEQPTPRPVVTRAAPFNPVQFLSCLAKRIHDEFFSFIPLREGGPSADEICT
jgi:hypothetical protein